MLVLRRAERTAYTRLRHAGGLTLAVLVLVLAGTASLAHAQGAGIYTVKAGTGRPACTSITNPVAGLTWCADGNDGTFKMFNGVTYVGATSGVATVNGLQGAIVLVGTTNQVNVVTAGQNITFGTPQDIAPGSSPAFAGLRITGGAPASTECLQIGSTGIVTPAGWGCGRLTSIGAQTGPAITTANDTNVTLAWAANVGTLGWTGTLAPVRGGFGADMSAASGVISFNAGARVVNNVLTAGRVLYAAAGNTVTSNANLTFNGTTLTLLGIAPASTECLQITSGGVVQTSGTTCGGGGGGAVDSLNGETGVITISGVANRTTINTTVGDIEITLPDDVVVQTLVLNSNGGTLPAQPTGSLLQIASPDASASYYTADAFGAQGGLILRRANGTPAARTALAIDNPIGAVEGRGAYDATNYSGPQASLGFFAAEAWTAIARGTYATIGVTAPGSTTLAEVARFTDTTAILQGGLTIIGIAPGSTECVQIDSAGALSASGAGCGGGGGSGVSALNSLTGGLSLVGVANRTTVTSGGTTITVTLPNTIEVDTSGNAATATVATGVLGGAAGRLAYWSSTTALTNTANLAWDNSAAALGIKTATPKSTLHVAGRMTLADSTTGNTFDLMANAYENGAGDKYLSTGFAGRLEYAPSTGEWFWQTAPSGSADAAVTYTTRMTVSTAGVSFAATPGWPGTSGGIPYFSSPTTLASSALLPNRGMVVGGGAGAAPRGLTALTNGQLYIGSTGADPVPSTITSSTLSVTPGAGALTLDVTGIPGGSAGRIPFWTSATAISNDAGLTWNNTLKFVQIDSGASGPRSLFLSSTSATAYNPNASQTPRLTLDGAATTNAFQSVGFALGSTINVELGAVITNAAAATSDLYVKGYTGGIFIERLRSFSSGAFRVSMNATTPPTPPTGTVAQFAGVDAAGSYATVDAFGSTLLSAPGFQGRRARGTAAAPSAVQTDDQLNVLAGFGYGATGYSSTARASVGLYAGAAWSDVSQPTVITFGVTPSGSTTLTEAARFTTSGTLSQTTASALLPQRMHISGTQTGARNTITFTLPGGPDPDFPVYVPGMFIDITNNSTEITSPPPGDQPFNTPIPFVVRHTLGASFAGNGVGTIGGRLVINSPAPVGHAEYAAISAQAEANFSTAPADAHVFAFQAFANRASTTAGAPTVVASEHFLYNDKNSGNNTFGVLIGSRGTQRGGSAIVIEQTDPGQGYIQSWNNDAIALVDAQTTSGDMSTGVRRFKVSPLGTVTVNPAAGFTGTLLELTIAGTNRLSITYDGASAALLFAGTSPGSDTAFGWTASVASFGWRIGGNTIAALDNGSGSGLVLPKAAGGGLRVACFDNTGRVVPGASATSC